MKHSTLNQIITQEQLYMQTSWLNNDCPNRLIDSTEKLSTGGGCLAITSSVRLEVVLEGR